MEELLGYGRADPPAGVFVDVSAGRFRTCGVGGDGALVCWGEAVGEIPEGRFTYAGLRTRAERSAAL